MGRIISILMIGLGGYYLFQNRYRALNILFGSSFLSKMIVSSFMRLPGVRDRMLKMVLPPSQVQSQ